MHTSEVVFTYNNIPHVSTTHLTIFREAIQMIKELKHTFIVVKEPIPDIKWQ